MVTAVEPVLAAIAGAAVAGMLGMQIAQWRIMLDLGQRLARVETMIEMLLTRKSTPPPNDSEEDLS